MTFTSLIKKPVTIFPIRAALFFFYGRAGLKMSRDLAPHITPGSRVLDLGCGTGIIGSTLAKKLHVSLVGTDVRDAREANIPFVLSNGKRLPFPDNSFDAVVISYVLHHVEKADLLLQEAKRVCRGKIVIYEDTPQNLFHRASCFLHGFSYGSLFGLGKRCKFRTQQEWLSLFQKLQLALVDADTIGFFNPIHVTARSLFILSPTSRKTRS